ncbi:FdhF/YdeP family oxidoreductase [Wohlfahrtiimonas sp. G9077]|uniref:FdhF/YdeP family oxidoreductase n=1 Tax=Wohlfahrtiimonas sp. G9077 TaxID=1980118 RepID=UPI000B97E63F|nr:FdhF/YdeP family oxidoreductase [Wohlfahrtiimonas sp. G9077]OYQ73741.1 CbbBc protein [Wohlfahrtiimonas sp. G9077]
MKEKIENYTGAAGGWGALKAVVKALEGQMDIREDAKAMFEMNKPQGFDCPGCAWPDPKKSPIFNICENGAKAVSWEATSKRATLDFFKAHTIKELLSWSDYQLEDAGRLVHPMKYDARTDTYQAIEWQTAFEEIGAILRGYDDPNVVEFYTSGRTSNEAAFLFQLYAREYGTNNFPDCSNMCHEPTSVGVAASIGVGKGTVLLEDFEQADLVMCIGHNPGTNHPRMLNTLRKVSERGATIVAINPMRERGLEKFIYPQNPVEMLTDHAVPLATPPHYYQVRVGGDTALMKGIMRLVIERHDAAVAKGEPAILDLDFIAEHTLGYEAVKDDVLSSDWADLERISGLSKSVISEIADLYIQSERTIICYGMGITQHQHGTHNIQQLINLLLLKGNIGKPGAGLCPLRGHSNVQGDRTVGITEKPSAEFLANIEKRFGFTPPKEWGHAVVASMQAIYEGRSKALISMGGNLAVAMADHDKTYAGMKGLDLAVHVATKLNRSHLLTAKHTYLFPVLGRTEVDLQQTGPQAVTVEDSMSMVHASRGVLKPVSDDVMSECAVVAGMAKATLLNTKVEWDEFVADYSKIRDAMGAVFPNLFTDYNEKIKVPGGFHLDNAASRRVWHTKSGKANFIPTDGIIEDPKSAFNSELVLATVRSHDQYNTTIYSYNDRYRGVFGTRDVLFLSEHEAEVQGLKAGDRVNVIALDDQGNPTDRRLEHLEVVIHAIADRCAATYFPEANNLLPIDSIDEQSGIPAYKNIPIRLEKVA